MTAREFVSVKPLSNVYDHVVAAKVHGMYQWGQRALPFLMSSNLFEARKKSDSPTTSVIRNLVAQH